MRWALTSTVYFDLYWPYAAADLAAIEAGNSLSDDPGTPVNADTLRVALAVARRHVDQA